MVDTVAGATDATTDDDLYDNELYALVWDDASAGRCPLAAACHNEVQPLLPRCPQVVIAASSPAMSHLSVPSMGPSLIAACNVATPVVLSVLLPTETVAAETETTTIVETFVEAREAMTASTATAETLIKDDDYMENVTGASCSARASAADCHIAAPKRYIVCAECIHRLWENDRCNCSACTTHSHEPSRNRFAESVISDCPGWCE